MIREPATEADRQYFRELNELSYRELVIEQFGAWDRDSQRAHFDEKWKMGGYVKIVTGGKVVGGIWTEEFADYIALREIQVHPDYQSRGIGTAVLMEEMERARSKRKELRLRVLLKNRAYGLYARLGFEETHKDESHFYMTFRV